MVFKCSYSSLEKVSSLLLIQNPKNNNKHSKEQIDRLAKIIDFQGQRSPIVVSKRSGFIVKGHARLMAIHQLGWDEAAVDYQDYKTEAEEYADMTADNEIARWAELDLDKIVVDLKDLNLGDIDLLGLKNNLDLEKTFAENTFIGENKSKELSLDEFETFDHCCPKCNFEWND